MDQTTNLVCVDLPQQRQATVQARKQSTSWGCGTQYPALHRCEALLRTQEQVSPFLPVTVSQC